MGTDRIHRTVSDDGTEIAGHVYGQGPPLVLVHGGVEDERSWRLVIPILQERFTCFPLSLRGRGLSADNPDMSPERHVEDVVAFVDSIAEPVGLVGHSSGGAFALAAAASTDRVARVATYEATFPELLDEGTAGSYQQAFERMAAAASEGKLVDAAQIMIEEVALANEDELAALAAVDAAEVAAPNVPALLDGLGFVTHRFLEDEFFERLTMPIALLYGARTHAFYRSVTEHLAGRLPDSRVIAIAGAGHMATLAAPADLAADLMGFFEAPAERAGHVTARTLR